MDRYWVGGTANWDATAGTKWATTSGGAGGAAVPTSADDVYFDANSGAVTVTVTSGVNCAALNFTGFTGTFTGNVSVNIYGSATISATTTWSHTGSLIFRGGGSRTLTSSGKAITGGVDILSSTTLSLSDALTTGTIGLTSGTFTTNDYNVTASSLSSSNSNTRTINLGSSTVTLSANAGIGFAISTNLTFNAGTSSIVFSGTGNQSINANNITFYDVSFSSGALNVPLINGTGNIFNNFTFAGATSAGVKTLALAGNQTINGTLTLSAGTNATMRTFVRSNTIGTTRTLTCAAVASLTDIDFRDITIAGAAAPVSGTRLGDCKGNSGITFDAAKTVYWNLTTGGNWSNVGWATTEGGTPSVDNFPLAQDTAVFTATYPNSGQTSTINAAYNIGTIDMSARTSNTMTLATSTTAPSIYGNWINGTGTTLSGTGTLTFAGRGSQTITSAGKTFTQAFTIDTPGGSVTLQDAFTTNRSSSSAVQHVSGTFDANDYNVTLTGALGAFVSSNTNVRALAIGAGTWTIPGTNNSWQASTSTNLTVTGTGTISLTSALAKTFNGGDVQTYPTLNQGGTGALTITGSNKFADITNTAIGRVQFTGGTTNEFTAFNLNGVSGNLLQVGSTNTTQVTLKAPSWNVGANSTDAGNNTGLTFSAGSVDYLSISYVNGELTAAPVISVFIIESATAADAQGTNATFNISMSETTTAADAAAAGFICLGTLAESATAADVAEALRAFLADVSESATSSDLLSAALTLSSAISELTTATDSAAVTSRVTNPTISEAAQMADALSGGLLFLSDISEATTAAEIAESVLIFNLAVIETTSVADITSAIATFRTIIPESVITSDALTALTYIYRSVTESTSSSDENQASNLLRSLVSESSQATDDFVVVPSTFVVLVPESSTVTDDARTNTVFPSQLSESLTVQDDSVGANTILLFIQEGVSTAEYSAATFIPLSRIFENSSALFDQISVTTTRFDYEAVKDLFSRKRTVYVSRSSSSSDRMVLVPAMNRTVYVSRSSTSSDNVALIPAMNRTVYVLRTTTSGDRTVKTD